MPEFVKKTALGGYKIASDGTDVVISRTEYDRMMDQIEQYNEVCHKNSDLSAQISSMEFEQKRKDRDRECDFFNRLKEYEDTIAQLRDDAQFYRDEMYHQQALNANLIRINRERANKDRHLQTGKIRSGYIITGTRQISINYRKNGRVLTDTAWETTIQSPFSIDFDPKVAQHQILLDLTRQGEKIGIDDWKKIEYDQFRKSRDYDPDKNIVFDFRAKWTQKGKYWELVVLHTRMLTKFEFGYQPPEQEIMKQRMKNLP